MGNRAVITTKKEWQNDGIGVYLHWNGGMDSVRAFLRYCELKGYRAPDEDFYGWARLCQVVGNFFGGGRSVGIDKLWYLDRDNGDNGVYIIEGWKVVDRYYHEGAEQDGYDLKEMLVEINKNMPEKEQLPEDFLTGDPTPVAEIKIGQKVFVQQFGGDVNLVDVVGIGEDRYVNGTNVKGIPYTNLYGVDEAGYANNINNYLRQPEYVVKNIE